MVPERARPTQNSVFEAGVGNDGIEPDSTGGRAQSGDPGHRLGDGSCRDRKIAEFDPAPRSRGQK